MTNKLENLNNTMKNVFKGFFILIIFFFLFFAVNLFISIQKNKSKSAYDALTSEYEKSQLKLQDTRTHSWSGAEKKK
ncbi:MAG: hypothetical protein A3I68_07565 [Candidatus Melainabacteria bacterium RIFCSPLOWO2_02_FULL_35_15]|nr:MAG: hypothetical protein A3F80_02960 [Candidatus Melainabacteria bacterium RIFCSPLOWO2_12_FULL_35_11]OGI14153.1 MAG: hypothetical protein A3I68_07565 [Candidatus Melainabacteria bacterium RIFCSPLOWO2_02_FULL_35_15]